MKRPPDRKLMLAATVLIVAAGMVLMRPAAGFSDPSFHGITTLLVKKG